MLDRNITPAFRRLLKRTFPDMELKTVLRLMRMEHAPATEACSMRCLGKVQGSAVSRRPFQTAQGGAGTPAASAPVTRPKPAANASPRRRRSDGPVGGRSKAASVLGLLFFAI